MERLIDLLREVFVERDYLKIQFYKKIKKIETKLKNDTPQTKIVLNSFIFTHIAFEPLLKRWNLSSADELEKFNVLNYPERDTDAGVECIEKMFKKMLSEGGIK